MLGIFNQCFVDAIGNASAVLTRLRSKLAVVYYVCLWLVPTSCSHYLAQLVRLSAFRWPLEEAFDGHKRQRGRIQLFLMKDLAGEVQAPNIQDARPGTRSGLCGEAHHHA